MKLADLTFVVGTATRGALWQYKDGKLYWNHRAKPVGGSYRCVEAVDQRGRFVGIVKWWLSSKCEVTEAGTYVARSYRRQGVASALWQVMLDVTFPRRVLTSAISGAGLVLVRKMGDRVEVYDDRGLRRRVEREKVKHTSND